MRPSYPPTVTAPATRVANWLFVLAFVGGLIGLLAWGNAVDELAAAEDAAIDVHSADYVAGHMQGRREMLETVRAAYQQGRDDAMEAVEQRRVMGARR